MKFYFKCFIFRYIILSLNSIDLKISFNDILRRKHLILSLFRGDFEEACIDLIYIRNLRNFVKPWTTYIFNNELIQNLNSLYREF